MKTYKNQTELDLDIIDNTLTIDDDVKFEFSFSILAHIKVVGNIDAEGINARDINAWDINARDINAWGINARNIRFYAVCFSCINFICKSIIGQRRNARYFCLDSAMQVDNKKGG